MSRATHRCSALLALAGTAVLVTMTRSAAAQADEPAPPATPPPATEPTPPATPPPPAPATPTTEPPTAPKAAPEAATPAVPPKGPPLLVGPDSMLKRYTSWDANLEGGVGRVLTGPGETTGLLRARAGVLVIRDPLFYAVGFTYELSHLSAATLGIEGEFLHLESGFWAQIGPLLDVAADKPRLGWMGSLGVSLIGVEYQGRDYNAYGYSSAIFGKIRIPIGMLGFAARGR